MKKRGMMIIFCTILILIIIIALNFSFKENNNSYKAFEKYFYEHYDANSCSVLFKDLTHDGIDELIIIQMLEENMTPENIRNPPISAENFHGAELVVLQVIPNGTVNELYKKYVSWQHPNWGQVFLYTKDNMEYLFEYNPYTMGGSSHFSYSLYYLSDEGSPVIVDAKQIDFQINKSTDITQQLSSFEQNVQNYIYQTEPLIIYYENEHGSIDFYYLETPPLVLFQRRSLALAFGFI